MPQAFKTKKGGEAIGISGVGGLAADGGSVLSIEEAAKTMPELQQRDELGRVVLDEDGKAHPLTGSALTKAAKDWAEIHDLEVVNVKEEEIGPSSAEALREHSIRRYEEVYAGLKPVNDDPDELAASGADEFATRAASVNPDAESAKED